MEYTKGETAGGWIYVLKGKMPIALVHPKHIDKFLAAPALYEALEAAIEKLKINQGEWASVTEAYSPEWTHPLKRIIFDLEQALDKAEARNG